MGCNKRRNVDREQETRNTESVEDIDVIVQEQGSNRRAEDVGKKVESADVVVRVRPFHDQLAVSTGISLIQAYSFSGGKMSAMHLQAIVMRTESPPPMRSKMKERRAASVDQDR